MYRGLHLEESQYTLHLSVQLFAEIVGENQSETSIHSTRHSIGSRTPTVAANSCMESCVVLKEKQKQLQEKQLQEKQLQEKQLQEKKLQEKQLQEKQLQEKQLQEKKLQEKQLQEKQLQEKQLQEKQLQEKQLHKKLRSVSWLLCCCN